MKERLCLASPKTAVPHVIDFPPSITAIMCQNMAIYLKSHRHANSFASYSPIHPICLALFPSMCNTDDEVNGPTAKPSIAKSDGE